MIGFLHHARFRSWWLWLSALTLALGLALLLWQGAAQAQAQALLPEGVTADEVNVVARELWCPLCSGVRLDSCELQACTQMKEVIGIKLAEGEDLNSIRNYFVAQYGPQVLGEPPRAGFNWLAWILPVVGLFLGGVFFWRKTRDLVRQTPSSSLPSSSPPASTSTRPGVAPHTDEEYEQKLAEELAKYG